MHVGSDLSVTTTSKRSNNSWMLTVTSKVRSPCWFEREIPIVQSRCGYFGIRSLQNKQFLLMPCYFLGNFWNGHSVFMMGKSALNNFETSAWPKNNVECHASNGLGPWDVCDICLDSFS